jgi:hypothetical protein
MLAKDLGLYAVNVELSFEQTVLLEHLELRQDAHVKTNPDVQENIYNYMDRQRSLDRWEDARKPSCPRFDQG